MRRLVLVAGFVFCAAYAGAIERVCQPGQVSYYNDTKTGYVCADDATGADPSPRPTLAGGASAPTGMPGADGAAGPAGPTGATGAQGIAGPTGVPGSQGIAGPTGLPGSQGVAGATGVPGAPAPTPTALPVLSAVYDPLTLAANTSRCDTVTVTGAVVGRPLIPMPQTTPAAGCDMAAPPRVSATNTVIICWRNVFSATTACDTASSTWLFTQP